MQLDTESKEDVANSTNPNSSISFDSKIAREIAVQCGYSISQLWDEERGTFWRSTDHRRRATAEKEHQDFFPTVTYRSTEALLDLIAGHPEWFPKPDRELILDSYLPKVLSRPLDKVKSTLDKEGAKVRNPFTTSLYLITLCKASEIEGSKSKIPDAALTRISSTIESLVSCCKTNEGSIYTSEMHPFIQFHVLRAASLALPFINQADESPEISSLSLHITSNIRGDIEKLLARHVLRELSPSDAVALIFCAATLALAEREEDRHYILPALEVGLEAQDSSGCWPLGRVVREDKDKQNTQDFEISTYEIAWAVSETLLKLARVKRESLITGKASLGFERLLLAAKYAQKSSVVLSTNEPPKKGWCSDHPYRKPFIESWTCANVLQSMISLQDLIEERTRQDVLRSFVTLDPRDEDWPVWLRWEIFKQEGEPEDDNPILQYLDEKIVKPIKRDPRNLPSASGESVSVLLFGPPGTSKTTLVQGVADGLGWPVAFLSPGDFIKEGLEYIEAQARFVFEQLKKLSRVVVLFDECDELFRKREPKAESEQTRNITAFVSASMLPKLQDLHDREKVVFFICTNNFDTLDPAIKRSGRIDHVIGVGPPQDGYRKRLITDKFKALQDGPIKNALVVNLTAQTDRFIRKEILRVGDMLLPNSKIWSTEVEVNRAIRNAVERVRGALTITEEDYTEFKEQKAQFSRPVTEGVSPNA